MLPYVVIVPALLKVANHKYSVAYIAAYLNKFLEKYPSKDDFKWEKMHVKYYEINKRTTKEKIIYYGASAEYLLLVIVIACIFWVKYFYQSTRQFTVFTNAWIYVFADGGLFFLSRI